MWLSLDMCKEDMTRTCWKIVFSEEIVVLPHNPIHSINSGCNNTFTLCGLRTTSTRMYHVAKKTHQFVMNWTGGNIILSVSLFCRNIGRTHTKKILLVEDREFLFFIVNTMLLLAWQSNQLLCRLFSLCGLCQFKILTYTSCLSA